MDNKRVTINPTDPEFYAELCNIFARLLYDIPDDDPFIHTSSEARKLAMQVVDKIEEYGEPR